MSEDNLVPEWFNFALDDLECARVLLRERRLRNVCYLCQQAAEKSLLQQYPHSVPLNEYAAETRYPNDYVVLYLLLKSKQPSDTLKRFTIFARQSVSLTKFDILFI